MGKKDSTSSLIYSAKFVNCLEFTSHNKILSIFLYLCNMKCDQKSQKQLFSPRRRCLNLLFRQQ